MKASGPQTQQSREPNQKVSGIWTHGERRTHLLQYGPGQISRLQLERLRQAVVFSFQARDSLILTGAAALRLVLISGRPIEELADLRRTDVFRPKERTYWSQLQTPTLVQVGERSGGLWLEVQPVRARSSASKVDEDGTQSPAVWLPVDPFTNRLLQRLDSSPKRSGAGSDLTCPHVFGDGDHGKLREAVEAFRGWATDALLLESPRDLPNANQCAGFLSDRLRLMKGGDAAVAHLLTNTLPPARPSQSYYTAMSLKEAACLHQRAIASVRWRENAESMVAHPVKLSLPSAIKKLQIGSDRCPPLETLTDLGERLRAAAKLPFPLRHATLAQKRAADEAFTAYTWLLFHLFTGCRPRASMLPNENDLDVEAGLLLIQDKSHQSAAASAPKDKGRIQASLTQNEIATLREAELKRRWVPLAPRVQEQLVAFRTHADRRSQHVGPGASSWVLGDVLNYLSKEFNWTFPSNFTRHAFRSALVGKVSGEVIDAYMGHWTAGSEPWWNGSCLDPLLAKHHLHTALDRVFPESKWPVIKCFR